MRKMSKELHDMLNKVSLLGKKMWETYKLYQEICVDCDKMVVDNNISKRSDDK